jgi:hypothetical protein
MGSAIRRAGERRVHTNTVRRPSSRCSDTDELLATKITGNVRSNTLSALD